MPICRTVVPPETSPSIETVMLDLVDARGPDKSICPTEVARAMAEDWRPWLGRVRAEAVRLAQAGRLQILRHGKPVADLSQLRGVIRLRKAL